MKLDLIKYALATITNRKTRSWLTIISVAIGILAIFSLLSFGLGIQTYVNTLSEEAGKNKVFIRAKGIGPPGSGGEFVLNEESLGLVEDINNVRKATGINVESGEIKSEKETVFNFLIGTNPEKQKLVEETFNTEIQEGQRLKERSTKEVILGYNYQLENEIFSEPLRIGDKISINNKEFEVSGFYERIGNPTDDSSIFMTHSALEELVPKTENKYSYGVAETRGNINETQKEIEKELRDYKNEEEGEETFYVQTFQDVIQVFTSIINILTGSLIIIGLISSLVAGVNIANTMYTSVVDRTKEIGIMKAIGATNKTIATIFMIEAGFLSLIGGVIGVIAGYSLSTFMGGIAASAGYSILQPSFPWYLFTGCLLFSFILGVISGFFPARNASKLNPVDALRYE